MMLCAVFLKYTHGFYDNEASEQTLVLQSAPMMCLPNYNINYSFLDKKRKCDTEDLTGGRDCFFKKIQQVNIPPSELADPRKFNRFQNEEDPLTLNYHPAQLIGLPVTLCNDILAKFQDNANGSIELVEEDIKFVQNLSYGA